MQKVPWLGKEATRKQFLKGIGQSEANAAAEKRTNKKETRRRKMLVYFVKRFYSFRVDLLTVTRPSHAKKVRLLCTSEPLIWNCHRLRFLYPELNKSVLQSSEHQQQHAAGRSLPRTLELLAPHCRPWPWHIVAHWTGHGHGTPDHSPPGRCSAGASSSSRGGNSSGSRSWFRAMSSITSITSITLSDFRVKFTKSRYH